MNQIIGISGSYSQSYLKQWSPV